MSPFAPTRVATLSAVAAAIAVVALAPDAALAYGGPGSVVTGVGAFLAALAAIVAAVFGFLWFPVKRLVAKLRGEETGGDGEGTDAGPGDDATAAAPAATSAATASGEPDSAEAAGERPSK